MWMGRQGWMFCCLSVSPEALAWPPTEWVSVMFVFGGYKKHHDRGNELFFFILHPFGMIGLIPSAWAPRNGQ